jgi:hypothetical protein
MNAHAISTMLLVACVLHLGITTAGMTMVSVLDWRRNLAPLSGLTRHIIWTHGAFVLLTIVGFGAVSLVCHRALVSGQPLARAICAFIAIFWGSRLAVGAFVFDARPYLTSRLLTCCYRTLNCVFVYFVICYGLAALV